MARFEVPKTFFGKSAGGTFLTNGKITLPLPRSFCRLVEAVSSSFGVQIEHRQSDAEQTVPAHSVAHSGEQWVALTLMVLFWTPQVILERRAPQKMPCYIRTRESRPIILND